MLLAGGTIVALVVSCCVWMASIDPGPRTPVAAPPQPITTGVADAGSAPAGDPTPGTLCGHADALPSATALSGWSGYRCRPAADGCLARAEYAEDRGHGCPGEMQCCPPRAVD